MFLKLKGQLFVLTSIIVLSAGTGRYAVALTANEFRSHTIEHIELVKLYMPIAYLIAQDRSFRVMKVFPDLNLRLVEQYAALHDWPKLQQIESLQKYGYNGPEDLATRLARFDGIDGSKLQGAERNNFINTRDETNRIEGIYKQNTFYKQLYQVLYKNRLQALRKTMPSEMAHLQARLAAGEQISRTRKQLEILERIVDWTVTKIFRWRELGLAGPTPRYAAAQLLSKTGATAWEIQLSMDIEDLIREASSPDAETNCSEILNRNTNSRRLIARPAVRRAG